MRTRKNRRHGRRGNQAEKRFLERTAKLEALIEALQRDRIEKRVDDAKQEVQETGKNFLELAAKARVAAEKGGVSQYVSKIDDLMNNVEKQGELLLGRFDNLKSTSATATMDVEIAESKLDDIYRETTELFNDAYIELGHFVDNIQRYSIEKIRQELKVYRTDFPKRVNELALIARAVKADKKLSKEIDDLRDYIEDIEINLIAETDGLNQLFAKPDVNEENKLNELTRVFDKETNYCQRVVKELRRLISELNPFIERKQRRQRFGTILDTIFMIACNIGIYVSWSYQEKMILPGWNETTTWILTGFILIIIATKANAVFSHFLSKRIYTLLHINRILRNIAIILSIIVFGVFLQLLTYVIISHFLYLIIFSIVEIISSSNQILVFVLSLITILAFFPLTFKDLFNHTKNIFLWLTEK